MSGPFIQVPPTGTPAWAKISAPNGNFSTINASGGVNIPEIGYDSGGYGQDGYDTPAVIIQGAGTPDWTLYTLK